MPTLIIPSPPIFGHPCFIIEWTLSTWSILIGQGFDRHVFEGNNVRFELAVDEEAFILGK